MVIQMTRMLMGRELMRKKLVLAAMGEKICLAV